MSSSPLSHEHGAAAPLAPSWTIHPSGERLLIVELAGGDTVQANRMARAFAARIVSARPDYVTDIVPALTTVGVHYDPARVPRDATRRMPFDTIRDALGALLQSVDIVQRAATRIVEIPVCYGDEHGPDLDEAACACDLSSTELIERHSRAPVDVMMLGFAPGHPYIGLFDETLSLPRRATPRTAVPPGSIGLANRQTVIYPLTLPGGWNLIGRTPLSLFAPSRAEPCLVQAGDQVRFVPISAAQFDALNEHPGASR
ncbi:5-oxoprolinase subunit PxpB [Paraburkholderia sediminicola]|uniref:5-oxoprolinase subunit PxpB n=1 Tax=Paraburkholderia sediminicola TaxID=458836 RepID=UPI0038BD64A9